MASLWLSHHHPEHLDRCVRVGPWHICRRCLLLWSLSYGLIALQVLARWPARHPLDLLIPVALLLPVLEFLEVHLGYRAYSPQRTLLLTPLLALVLGRLLYRTMAIPWDPATWAVILVAGIPCAWAAWRFSSRSQAHYRG